MKKLYTLLLSGFISAIGFSASAALGAPTVDPPSGVITGVIDNTYVFWDHQLLEETGTGLNVTISVNGGAAQNVTAYLDTDRGYMDTEENKWVDADGSTSIVIDWAQYALNSDWTKKPGVYEITIPAGVVSIDGEENDVVNITYTVMSTQLEEDIEPACEYGKVYSSADLKGVTVTFGNPITKNENAAGITCSKQVDSDTSTGKASSAETVINGYLNPELVTVNEYSIVMDLSGLANGSWNITIPVNYVMMNEYTGNQTVYLNYTVFNGMAQATVLEPEENSHVILPGWVDVTWNYQQVTPTEKGLTAYLSYSNSSNVVVKDTLPSSAFALISFDPEASEDGGVAQHDATAGGNVLKVNVGAYMKDAMGQVSLTLPEGIVENASGSLNPEQIVSFTVTPVYDGNYVITKSDNTLSVSLTWENVEQLSLTNSTTPAFLEVPEGENIYLAQEATSGETQRVSLASDGKSIVFDLSGLDLNGEYVLIVPEAYALINLLYTNTAIYYSLEIEDGEFSGVKMIEASKLEGPVYDLQGVNVGESLKGLRPGLYILGGKKVIVK